MFRNPFSFNGRIRRLEYGITFIIYVIVYLIQISIIETGEIGALIGLAIIIPLIWFVWAQGAKRCHDIGRSGWWQLIPLYFLVLIFQDGTPGRNEYGPNAKEHPEGDHFGDLDSETLDGHLHIKE